MSPSALLYQHLWRLLGAFRIKILLHEAFRAPQVSSSAASHSSTQTPSSKFHSVNLLFLSSQSPPTFAGCTCVPAMPLFRKPLLSTSPSVHSFTSTLKNSQELGHYQVLRISQSSSLRLQVCWAIKHSLPEEEDSLGAFQKGLEP